MRESITTFQLNVLHTGENEETEAAMKAKRKRRMSRRRRERTYIAVMVLLAIAVSIGLTRSVMRDDKEFEEFEQQSQEFDARMQRLTRKERHPDKMQCLSRCEHGSRSRTQNRTSMQYSTPCRQTGEVRRTDLCSMRYRRNTVGAAGYFPGKDAGIYILRLQAVRGQI